MSIAPGARLGAYEILSLLGAGGMGEVYRARDTRLNRDVAIKVLPDAFAADADRVARFKREAQVLASLNHPHIAAIYGVEEEGPAKAGHYVLILELVDGPTLADRIAQGPMPIDDALPIARQIAEALKAAHDNGVVHRDLKPANIKLTPDDKVKVLDFGLAKAMDRSPAEAGHHVPNVSMSPTITSPAMTMGGVILGTAAYMSPEQAKGKVVDKQSDIWAFGCVLFEMLTGKRAFEGQDVSDTMAAILRAEPDWTLLPRDASGTIATLLRRCLEKDRNRRVGDISAALFVLNEPALLTSTGGVATVAVPRRTRERVAWVAVLVAAIVATGGAALYFRPAEIREPERRLSVALPKDASVGNVAVSPDGGKLALTMRLGTDDRAQIWVRSLDAHELHPLPGTFASRTPFWSPDGRSIGFFADGKLKVIPAAGGPPLELCDGTGLGTGGTWNRNGVILFGNMSGTPVLRRVDAAGGPCADVTRPSQDGTTHAFPMFLPDGEHFLYVAGGPSAKSGVYIASLSEPDKGRRLLTDVSSVFIAPPDSVGGPAHLLFLRGTTLMAQAFDLDVMTLIGDPFPAAAGATVSASAPQVAAGVSDNRVLAYVSRPPVMFQLTWVDRAGDVLQTVGPAADLRGIRLSPTGQTVIFSRDNIVWSRDLVRGVETSLGDSFLSPVWSPDSARFVGAIGRGGSSGGTLAVRDLATDKQEELAIGVGTSPRIPSDWSRDGRSLLYTVNDPKTQGDIWVLTDPLNLRNARKATPFLVTNSVESQAQLSPDGQWVAYTSNESGQYAVYIASFPSGSGKRRVSSAEGREPRWGGNGQELYYLAGSSVGAGGRHRLMAVPVRGTPTEIVLGIETVLFAFTGRSIVPQGNAFQYAPAPDGKRFLVATMVGESEAVLHVVTNWRATQ